MGAAKKVAVYLRVSTQDQSTALQSGEIATYVTAKGYEEPTIYEDKATGTNSNRPMLKALMDDAKSRKFDVVVVWKLDRFARSLKDLVTHLQELSDLGIEFVSLKDHIDLGTSSGRLMMHIIGAFAQFEADIIKERVKSGIASAKAKGKALGRPRTIDSNMVRELRDQGLSLSQIAKRLGASKAAVHKTLSRTPSTIAVTNRDFIKQSEAS